MYIQCIGESVDSLCRDETDDGHAYGVIHFKTVHTFKRLDCKAFWIAYCVSGVVFYSQSIPASLQRPVRVSYGIRQNRDLSSSSSSSLKRPTARLVGPEAMIHLPNCFALPCAVPFHKINAGYEATTTTVNSSCLMYS